MFLFYEAYKNEQIKPKVEGRKLITRSEINRQQMVEKINNTKCWISSIIKFIKLIGIAIK